ncbi:hypothetical protein A3J20_00640 [Candidatus Gottesmanbacteria bacterium RIFCSPLOWO2_02_FULL_42_29]|uniref:DUF4012 domain-containing protein n=2 Tax=Candidatus Gottesmaniibacteriota TaxID=1752720 RepID=A0A1F6BFV7_9BACT|nr:MAG: hypothetical protein UV09_C0005G0008 [Candidatus Gottesmanbacteria bacterium GW2011_GWA2_42_18]OGG09258.1 MAG: hypothetical protein A2781_02880 [Candidatus Gottesmanbacteria bacterium RIFCSPHIGHO2_01_FULL_42_27]OGG21666.1 MAG: hypothetical protein A3E72_05715 [Candidatus Gottesmanbacteria bacterium RIFCSPHIGHO2_12_FULL_43_26]OGG34285.1 MAG: hypothetical protein A3G68_05315 [Candidatus Gottesmanbacteria bacterium RIFCSPLOWO2_12_FULL_42_10]OGG35829.1 MAG: hypothetical protein A2968_05930 
METFGYNKISFDEGKKPDQVTTVKKFKGRRISKRIFLTSLILPLLIIIIGLILYFPLKDLKMAVSESVRIAGAVYQAGKKQDIEKVQPKLGELKKSLEKVDSKIKILSWLSPLPVIGNYQKDAASLVKGSIYGVEAAQITVDTIVPYADLLGLKGKSTFVSGSADDRIKTAVETMDKIVPSIDKIAAKIELAEKELDRVDPARYPEKIGKTVVRARMAGGKKLFSETASLFVEAQPFLRNLPQLLGNQKEKRYLVIFQNDAELRATGGFMTAFAIFKVDKGKLTVERSDDIYKLDEAKKRSFPAPDKIALYHKDVPNFQLRDSNLSPDFRESMTAFEKLLSDSSVDLGEYQGIVALDTHVLVSTVKILGDFTIAGRIFSAENDKRCDCPKIIYEMEDYATRPVAFIREDRKGIIGTLLYQIMQRALGVSPSQYWGKLSQMFLEEASQKHLLFYFKDEEPQKGIEALNFGGRMQKFEGDYLHINNVNFAGAKSNLFVRNFVRKEGKTGDEAVHKLVLTYKNPEPASNCNLEAGQLCLNGILRNWLRVYVPKGSELIEFKGSEKKTLTYEEFNRSVFEGFFTVKPQGSATVEIRYKIPSSVDAKKLYIQKQPGTQDHEYTVSLNGHEQKVILNSDAELSFN